MAHRRVDLVGQRFSRLLVQSEAESRISGGSQFRYFLCLCDCGRTVTVRMDALRRGRTQSCGCLNREQFTERARQQVPDQDLTGKKFGRLFVTRRAENQRIGSTFWLCDCVCGTKDHMVARTALVGGRSRSCGCFARETYKERGYKHGGVGTPEYNVWNSMRDRCRNPKNPAYFRYGGRGITVDERWNKFVNFIEDMGKRPGKGYSLDRIDNDKGYSKENCRWATSKEQANNTALALTTMRTKLSDAAEDFEELDKTYQALRDELDEAKTLLMRTLPFLEDDVAAEELVDDITVLLELTVKPDDDETTEDSIH